MSVKPVISALLATAALLSAGSAAAVAAATPNVVVTPGTVTSGGVTLDAETLQPSSVEHYTYWYNDVSNSTVTKDATKVVIAPTPTSAGLAELYKVSTVTTTVTNHLASYDQFRWSQSMTGTAAANEYVTFSGTINATTDTTGWFSLYAYGSYTAQPSPLFGTATPALPSFYFRTVGSTTWTALSSENTINPEKAAFSSYAYHWVDLAAGTPLSFEVATLAGSAVDLSEFTVNLRSTDYNLREQVVSVTTATTETLVGAQLLAPVPEPETYALFAAGLLFVVMRLRNRNR